MMLLLISGKNKLIILSILCFIFSGTLHSQTVDVDFPYNLPLTSGDGLTLIKHTGKNTTNNTTITLPYFDGSGMKVASEGVIGGFSGAYFNDLSFSTSNGFVIEFVYEFYSKTNSSLGQMGDGFALVLFDGSVSSPTIGSNGSGLGYAYNRIQPKSSPGLPGGFLGIGFDVFGAYKNQGFSQISDKGESLSKDHRTGIYVRGMAEGFHGATDLRNFVTIRGPINPIKTYGDNMAGYPVLFSQNTINPSLSNGTLYNARLNPSWTGSGLSADAINAYVYNPVTMKSFSIAGGYSNVAYPSANYRKVRIEMIPDPSTSGVFYINVLVTTDDAQNPIKVVDKFRYDENSSIIYPEVINHSMQAFQAIKPTSMSMKAPKSLKLGWTASTGNAWANIVLKDASVTLPYSPIVTNDFAELCYKVNSTATVKPLDNDYGYGINPNPTTNPVPSKDNISKDSFRFMVPKGNGQVGYTANSNPIEYTSSYATYKYDKATGIVTATVINAAPDGKVDNVYYDVTDKTRTGKEYRSKVATIAFTFKSSLCAIIKDPEAISDEAALCNTSGSIVTISPLANDKGYNGGVIANSEYLDKSSFTFTNSAGTALSVTKTATSVTYSTSKATYEYTYLTGYLKIKALAGVANGNTDVIYYTVKNLGGTVASNTTTITSKFSSSLCEVPNPIVNPDNTTLCNTSGATITIYPLANDMGYTSTNSGPQYLDKSSFTFTNSAGTPLTVNKTANNVTYSTSNATYVYTYSSGELVIKNLTTAVLVDKIYYTVKNIGGTIVSNTALISTSIKNCKTEPLVPVLRDQLVDDICKTAGTTFTFNPFTGVTNGENIDKSSFVFDDAIGSSFTYDATYATYAYNPSTGLITGVVKSNTITTTEEYYDIINYSVMSTGGTLRSESVKAIVIFNDLNCARVSSGWIKINGSLNRSTNKIFINGMGGLPPHKE